MGKINVLMTSAGNYGFPAVYELVKSGDRNIKIVGVDIRRDASGIYISDKGYIVPSRSSKKHLFALLNICKREKIDIIYPLSTEDQYFYAVERRFFESKGIGVVVSSKESLKIANNKYQLMEFSEKEGIPIPKFHRVKSKSDIQKKMGHLGFPDNPFVIKLDLGTGASGVKIVHRYLDPKSRLFDRFNINITLKELELFIGKIDPFPDMQIQEYLPGDEYSVDILCEDGRILSTVVRKRYSTQFGLTIFGEVVNEKTVAEVAEKIVTKLKLSYVVNIQIKRDAKGKPKLMEINPRIPGTILLTGLAGVNMPYLALKLVMGEKIILPKPKIGTTLIRYWCGIKTSREDINDTESISL